MKITSLTGLALAGALGMFAVAHAEDTSKADASGVSATGGKSKSDGDRLICKRENDTGTRTGGKRTCLTAAQWAARTANDREAFEDNERHRNEPQQH